MSGKGAGEDYVEHFERYLGPMVGRSAFRPPWGPSIQVLEFANVFRAVGVVASLGLSHYAGQVARTVEVVFGADFGAERLESFFGRSLFHVIQQEVPLHHGAVADVVSLVDPDWVRETGKPGLCFVEPTSFPDAFARTAAGRPVLQAVPISGDEAALARTGGAAALLHALEAAGIDPFDVRRASVV